MTFHEQQKKKAVTFSYDDGVPQDRRLAEIFDCYGMKGTFNFNSTCFRNSFTDEECYIMTLCANDLLFDVCINKEDLYGEPAVGRRFKGVIWLQGYVNYPDV